MVNIQISHSNHIEYVKTGSNIAECSSLGDDLHVEVWKISLSHFPASLKKQDERCYDDRAPVSLSISMWRSQSFYAKNSCCLLLAGNLFTKLHILCGCAPICLSVHNPLSAHDESVSRNYSMWLTWNKRKTSRQTLSSPDCLHCQSVLQYVSNPRLNQGWLPWGLGLQLNRLYWRNRVHARTLPWQSSFILQCLSVSDRVCLCVWFQ